MSVVTKSFTFAGFELVLCQMRVTLFTLHGALMHRAAEDTINFIYLYSSIEAFNNKWSIMEH